MWAKLQQAEAIVSRRGSLVVECAFYALFQTSLKQTNKVINCVTLAEASELQERGTSIRKEGSRDKQQRNGE